VAPFIAPEDWTLVQSGEFVECKEVVQIETLEMCTGTPTGWDFHSVLAEWAGSGYPLFLYFDQVVLLVSLLQSTPVDCLVGDLMEDVRLDLRGCHVFHYHYTEEMQTILEFVLFVPSVLSLDFDLNFSLPSEFCC
jgi:hypothetical protein